MNPVFSISMLLLASVTALAGCSTPMPADRNEEYTKYLLQRIETLEQRTERNEYAVVGLNRRVTGLANAVTTAPPQLLTAAPVSTQRKEAYDEQQSSNEPIHQSTDGSLQRGTNGAVVDDAGHAPAKLRTKPAKPKSGSAGQPSASSATGT
jgi:hypothetical protein